MKFVIFCSLFLIPATFAQIKLDASLIHCCNLGIKWGREGLRCQHYPAPVAGVEDGDQKPCLSTVRMCCNRVNEDDQCVKGIEAYKTNHSCPTEETTCPDKKKQCCETCHLGKLTGEAKVACFSVELFLDEDLKRVFQECCTEVNPPPQRRKNPDPMKGRYREEEGDYEDGFGDYGENPSDNLCVRMAGQLCAHTCVATVGSYYCKCREGYTLMEDQKTCQQDKRPPKSLGGSGSPSAIVPNPEKPVPLYKPVNQGPNSVPDTSKSCKDNNPCEQECVNTETGINCTCRPGYEIDSNGRNCNDINECLDGTYVCDPDMEMCVNEVGGYRCAVREGGRTTTRATTTIVTTTERQTTTEEPRTSHCPVGYLQMSGGCADIDECDTDTNPEVCEPNEVCLNAPGSYECRCNAGYQKDPRTKLCVDINECQTKLHDCQAGQRCDNTIGSYLCHRFTSCGTGYTLNAHTGSCEDDDECSLGTDNCRFLGSNYQCRNTLGSFRCERKKCTPGEHNCTGVRTCPNGYHEKENGQCVDSDECRLGTHNCNPYSDICVNRQGSFECRKFLHCPAGYEPGKTGCVDVNECQNGRHNCRGSAECRNHNGGYTCHCPQGYQLGNDYSCEDINECNSYACPVTAECQNTQGSYRCICKTGFRNIDATTCEDVNECVTSPGLCQHDCTNIYGSYRCSCKIGFKLHEDNRTCADLDECKLFNDQRYCVGECVNTPGSFACRCPPGYTLGIDGRSCQDVDECIKHPCRDPDEVCLNTRGSFRCNSIKCPPDYFKDADHKNRCRRVNPNCIEGDTECLLQPVTYSYNFITFVSMLPIPPSGYLDLFTMRGPHWSFTDSQFSLALASARAASDVVPASMDYFRLRSSGWNQAVIALVRPIPGPQDLELHLQMKLYQNGLFGGVGVAKLFIHVSKYEF